MKKFVLQSLFFFVFIQNIEASSAFLTPKDSILHHVQNLNKKGAHKELKDYVNKAIATTKISSTQDSLLVAKLSYYQSKANYELNDYWASIKSSERGIQFSPNTTEGIEYRGRLYADKAWPESKLALKRKAIKSLKKGIDYLVGLSNKTPSVLDYTVNSYVLLSGEFAYLGDLESAQYYLRLADKLYTNNKKALDALKIDANGNYERYEIVLLYRKIYLMYKLGKSKKDSIEIENTIKTLEKAHKSKLFNKNERVYYSTSLNHIGDWYLGYKADTLLTKLDIEKGNYYIDKSIDLIQNKKYPGSYFSFMFNKCKALTKLNDLNKADALITHLLDSVPVRGYKPFFLAQKGLIAAKKKEKNKALQIFHKVIEYVHTGEEKLAKDYKNFKPSEVFGQTKLISRVAEKLVLYYGDDPEVRKIIAKLYHIAFVQFENSYGKAKFNAEENELLRKILRGFLLAKKEGIALTDVSIEAVLSKTETIINRRAWEQFKQNRYTNALSNLDSITSRELELKTALVVAQKSQNIEAIDSVQQLLYHHISEADKLYSNLTLFRDYKFSIAALQKKLSNNEMIVKYLLLQDYVAVFSITSKAITWELKPWLEKEQREVYELTTGIVNRSFNEELSRILSEKLLPKIDNSVSSLIINPDGELYKIPFEILYDKNEPLFQRFDVHYSSNLGFINEKESEHTAAKKTYIYAPNYEEKKVTLATRGDFGNLDGAKKEAEIIAGYFPSKIFMDANATKENFIKTASSASMLHLAMHAEVNENEAGLSRFVFGENENIEENLYLDELYALNLKADLAVLSACNTAVGKENAGRGIESFQRAFSFIGVSSVVASLWEVPDIATSQIMEAFYKELKNGERKSEALRRAKKSFLKSNADTKLADPFYWAGFVVYGNDSPVVEKRTHVLVIIMSLLMIVVGFYYKWKQRYSNRN